MSCVRLAQWIRKKLLLCIDTHIHTVRLVDAMRDHFLNVPYRLLLLFGHELAQSMAIRIEWNEERESERDKIKESTFAIIWPFTSHFVAWHFYCTNHIRHLLIENGKKNRALKKGAIPKKSARFILLIFNYISKLSDWRHSIDSNCAELIHHSIHAISSTMSAILPLFMQRLLLLFHFCLHIFAFVEHFPYLSAWNVHCLICFRLCQDFSSSIKMHLTHNW